MLLSVWTKEKQVKYLVTYVWRFFPEQVYSILAEFFRVSGQRRPNANFFHPSPAKKSCKSKTNPTLPRGNNGENQQGVTHPIQLARFSPKTAAAYVPRKFGFSIPRVAAELEMLRIQRGQVLIFSSFFFFLDSAYGIPKPYKSLFYL